MGKSDNNEIDVKSTKEKFENEVKGLESLLKESNGQKRKIAEYMLSFSEQVASVLSSDDPTAFKLFKENILEAEEQINEWINGNEELKKKINELIIVNEQVKENLAQFNKKKNSEIGDLYKFHKRKAPLLKKIKGNLEVHNKVLLDFQAKVNKWKEFVSNKAKEKVNKNLLKWDYSDGVKPFLNIPQEVKDLKSQLTLKEGIKDIDNFINKNKVQIIFSQLAAFLIFSFILYLLYKGGAYLRDIFENKQLNAIINSVINSRILVSISIAFFSLSLLLGKITKNIPSLLEFVIVSVALSTFIFWLGININVAFISNFQDDKKEMDQIPFLQVFFIFLLTNLKLAESILHINSELLVLASSLLMIITFTFMIKTFRRFNIFEEKRKSVRLINIGKTVQIFIQIVLGVFVLAAVFEIAGFKTLGHTLQVILVGNLITLGSIWVINTFLVEIVYIVGKKLKGLTFFKYKNTDDIGIFARKAIGIFLLVTSFYLIVESWAQNIFFRSEIWDMKVFSVGNYTLVVSQIIKLIASFYIFKGIYVLLKVLFNSFSEEVFKIPKRDSAKFLSISKYSLILATTFVCTSILGVTYKNLIFITGALGVGIGFGLQNIVNNFISGVILIFEQPIRIGDLIEVEGELAIVSNIGIRSTIVSTLENSAVIIPNSLILSNQLTNWTLNDNFIRLTTQVGVAYGSDTTKVTQILLDVVKADIDILKSPTPQVWFDQFGDSSLNFVIKYWIDKPTKKFIIQSNIMHRINESLKDNGIVIPFPQRDIHIKTEGEIAS